MATCSICKVQLDQPGMIETMDCGGDCLGCMAEAGDPDAARTLRKEIKGLRAALGVALQQDADVLAALRAANELCQYALPKFNWGASALDAQAIKLLNETPAKIANALKGN